MLLLILDNWHIARHKAVNPSKRQSAGKLMILPDATLRRLGSCSVHSRVGMLPLSIIVHRWLPLRIGHQPLIEATSLAVNDLLFLQSLFLYHPP